MPAAPLCIRCGENPRPKRRNWEKVLKAGLKRSDVSEYHHLCRQCFREVGKMGYLKDGDNPKAIKFR